MFQQLMQFYNYEGIATSALYYSDLYKTKPAVWPNIV